MKVSYQSTWARLFGVTALLSAVGCFSAEETPPPETKIAPTLPDEAGTPVPNATAACVGRAAGESFCSGQELLTCSADRTSTTSRVCDGLTPVCLGSACVACTPGAERCEGKAAYRCDEKGFWQQSSECPFTCVNGSCGGICTPGETRCDGKTPSTCGADGVWQKGAECAFVCNADGCAGECTPGEASCDGQVPRTCGADGKWTAAAACEFVCSKGECKGSCEPGDKQCSGADVQTCGASGAWQTSEACPFVCGNGACGGECKPGQKKCDGKVPQSCGADGKWKSGDACSFVCTDGACAGACTPGEASCNGQVPTKCDTTGNWQPAGAACGFLCSQGACTGECVPGAGRCNKLQPETCGADGKWQAAGSPCPYVCGGSGSCTGECVPGTPRCGSSSYTQICSADGAWSTGTSCPGANPACVTNPAGVPTYTTYAASCNNGQCGAPSVATATACTPPASKCASGQLTQYTAGCDAASGCTSVGSTTSCPTQDSTCGPDLDWHSYSPACKDGSTCGSAQPNKVVYCASQTLAAPYCKGSTIVSQVPTCDPKGGCGKDTSTYACPSSGNAYQCGYNAQQQPIEVPRVPDCDSQKVACTMRADTASATVCQASASCDSVCILELRGRCIKWGTQGTKGTPYCDDATGRCATRKATSNCWGSYCADGMTARTYDGGCSNGNCSYTDTKCTANQQCWVDPDTSQASCVYVIL